MSLQSALSTYEDNIGYLIQYYHDIWQMCKDHNISMTTQGGEDQPISAWADLIADALEEGGSAVLGTKNITVNDTYNASDDGLDGYSSVTVNVSGGGANLENDVVFTTNGLKNPSAGYDGFGPVTVQVPTTGGRMMGQLQLPFYSVSTWVPGNSYVVGDVVKWKLNYYYCIEDNHDDNVMYFSHWAIIIETPVTGWTAGTTYKIGDIVTYNTTEYYYCIENNQDTEFTPAHWIQMNV